MNPAEQRIIDAWMNEGPNPAYHRMIKERVRSDWPTLALAVEALVVARVVGGGRLDALRTRCSFVYPSRARCANSVIDGSDMCRTHEHQPNHKEQP